MRTLVTMAAGAAALTGVAHAAEPTFSGNATLATDYTFRGISQTEEGPALQGGFDYGYDLFYAGVWGSNVDLASGNSLELDVYAGVKPTFGAVTLDIGAIGYFYPGADDDLAELDYFEGFAKVSIALNDQASIGGAVFASPEFTGETGTAVYGELNGALALTDAFSLSGAVGIQQAEDADFDIQPGQDDAYTTWNVGGTVSAYGFSFDLRYVGTDVEDVDIAEDRVVFSIKRAF